MVNHLSSLITLRSSSSSILHLTSEVVLAKPPPARKETTGQWRRKRYLTAKQTAVACSNKSKALSNDSSSSSRGKNPPFRELLSLSSSSLHSPSQSSCNCANAKSSPSAYLWLKGGDCVIYEGEDSIYSDQGTPPYRGHALPVLGEAGVATLGQHACPFTRCFETAARRPMPYVGARHGTHKSMGRPFALPSLRCSN